MNRRTMPQGRARLRRALESLRCDEYEGSTESRPTEGDRLMVSMHAKSETRLFVNRPRCGSPTRDPDRASVRRSGSRSRCEMTESSRLSMIDLFSCGNFFGAQCLVTAQVSKPAVSPTSKSAAHRWWCGSRVGKLAIRRKAAKPQPKDRGCVVPTSRSGFGKSRRLEATPRLLLRTCCGWSRATQPRSVPFVEIVAACGDLGRY